MHKNSRNLEIILRLWTSLPIISDNATLPYIFLSTSFRPLCKIFYKITLTTFFIFTGIPLLMKFRESVLHRSVTFFHYRAITRLELSALLSFEIGRWRGVHPVVQRDACCTRCCYSAVLTAAGIRAWRTESGLMLQLQKFGFAEWRCLKFSEIGSLSVRGSLYFISASSGLIALVCSLYFELLLRKLRKGSIRVTVLSVARHAIYYVGINEIRPSRRSKKSSVRFSFKFLFSFHNNKRMWYEKFVYLTDNVLNRQLCYLTI